MNKIKILLIDDNPTTLMEDEGNSFFIPSFNFGYSDSDFPQETISSNFEMGWLQSPRDVQEFRNYSEEVIQRFGREVLFNEGFIPEIVLFDYKLSEGLDKFLVHDLEHYESIIPTYKLSKIIEKKSHRFFDWNQLSSEIDNYKAEIEKEESEDSDFKTSEDGKVSDAKTAIKKKEHEKTKGTEPAIFSKSKDDMGCFSGGLIAFQFKDFPCIGIPITSKDGEIDVSPEALYFEWLLSKDFDGQFGKKYGKKPFWNEVIPQAVLLLRNRIKSLVKIGKLIPFYDQLIRLSKVDTTERYFSFTNSYGKRHLPLDGLFIDKPETNRKEEIKNWAIKLLDNLPRNNADIERVIDVSNGLWKVFCDEFGDRMILSTYALWEEKGILNSDGKAKFEKLKSDFGIEKGELKLERSIQEEFPYPKDDIATLRLAILHLVTDAAIKMNKCKKESDRERYRKLNLYENYNLLYPKVLGHLDTLVLPMQLGKKEETRKKQIISGGTTWLKRNIFGDNTGGKDWNDFEDWITEGEKAVLKAIFVEDQYYPNWLK